MIRWIWAELESDMGGVRVIWAELEWYGRSDEHSLEKVSAVKWTGKNFCRDVMGWTGDVMGWTRDVMGWTRNSMECRQRAWPRNYSPTNMLTGPQRHYFYFISSFTLHWNEFWVDKWGFYFRISEIYAFLSCEAGNTVRRCQWMTHTGLIVIPWDFSGIGRFDRSLLQQYLTKSSFQTSSNGELVSSP